VSENMTMNDEEQKLTPSELGAKVARPDDVPEKFWNAESGEIRVDPLLQSYRALEKKLSERSDQGPELPELSMSPVSAEGFEADPDDNSPGPRFVDDTVNAVAPTDYEIAVDHGLFDVDPRVNERLREAGFSPEQAQLVYDMAAEELMPVTQEIAETLRMEIDDRRLEAHFGGAEKWPEMQRQLKAWGQSNLPEDAFESLASSYDGVQALHRLMQGSEPRVIQSGQSDTGVTEAGLRRMVGDPRYWRDRDPALVREVTEGFHRLYPSDG
jgi:hypothetical protein